MGGLTWLARRVQSSRVRPPAARDSTSMAGHTGGGGAGGAGGDGGGRGGAGGGRGGIGHPPSASPGRKPGV